MIRFLIPEKKTSQVELFLYVRLATAARDVKCQRRLFRNHRNGVQTKYPVAFCGVFDFQNVL